MDNELCLALCAGNNQCPDAFVCKPDLGKLGPDEGYCWPRCTNDEDCGGLVCNTEGLCGELKPVGTPPPVIDEEPPPPPPDGNDLPPGDKPDTTVPPEPDPVDDPPAAAPAAGGESNAPIEGFTSCRSAPMDASSLMLLMGVHGLCLLRRRKRC